MNTGVESLYPDLSNEYVNYVPSRKREDILRRIGNYVETAKKESLYSGRGEEARSWTGGRRYCCHSSCYSFFTPTSYNFFSPTVIHHHEAPKSREQVRDEKERSDQNFRLVIGVACGVTMVVMSYFIGLEVKTIMETNEDIGAWDDFEQHVEDRALCKRASRFFADQNHDSWVRLGLKIAICAAAALGGLGAIVASNALMVGALAMGVLGLCGYAIYKGVHSGDQEKYSRQALDLWNDVYEIPRW